MSLESELSTILNDFAVHEGRSVALSFLDGSLDLHVRGEQDRPAASVIKAGVVAAMHWLAARGELDIDRRVRCSDIPGTGAPSIWNVFRDDLELSVSDLSAFAIVMSDNPTATYLTKLVRPERVTAYLHGIDCSKKTVMVTGFEDRDISERPHANRTTAADCITLLKRIASDPDLAPLEAQMANCVLNARIPGYLGGRFRISHKTGTFTRLGVVNDVGLLYHPRGTFALAYLTEGEPDIHKAALSIADCTHRVIEVLNDLD